MKGWLRILSVGMVAIFTAAGCSNEVTEGGGAAAGSGGDEGEGGSGGGGGAGGSGATATHTVTATAKGPTFGELYVAVLGPHNCTNGYCHGSWGAFEDLHQTFVNLVGASSEDVTCGNAKLVVPGDPEASLLYQKVSMAKPPCGKPMPMDQDPLSAAEIAVIAAWIEAGAKE